MPKPIDLAEARRELKEDYKQRELKDDYKQLVRLYVVRTFRTFGLTF